MKGGNGDIKRTQVYDKAKEVETAATAADVAKETANIAVGKPDESVTIKASGKSTVDANKSP